MTVIMALGKAAILFCLIVAAAGIGLLVCGFLGIFMGPAKLFEWTRNGDTDVSTDSI